MFKDIGWILSRAARGWRACLAPITLACALGTPAFAAAAPWPTAPAPEVLLRMPAAEAVATLRRVATAQRALAPRRAGQLDTTPPVLTRFDGGPAVNVNRQLASARAPFEARDDQSGVSFLYAEASSDKGGFLHATYTAPQPVKRLEGVLAVRNDAGDLLLPPGTYTFGYVWVIDGAGNLASYDRAALAALGDPTVQVRNPQGFDTTGVTLVNGVILTPELSLSDHHPGTDQPPYFALRLGVEETGGTMISGAGYSRAEFCLKASVKTCLWAYDQQRVPHQTPTLLTLANQLSDEPPGVYHLASLLLIDLAGNYTSLVSKDFGGDIDFSRYFPSTTITVTQGEPLAPLATRPHRFDRADPLYSPCDPEPLMAEPAAGTAAARLDVTPPVITRFDADPELNVDGQLATLRVRFEANDDKSGVVCIIASAHGPKGDKVLYVYSEPALPAKHLSGVLADGGQPKDMTPPGTYTFEHAFVYDAAGHFTSYDAAALAALGNTVVKVRNPQGYDLKPPALVSGTILTPEISLSAHHPGTDHPPYFSLKLGVEDRGNSMTSGLESANVTLCTLGLSRRCIYGWMHLDLPRQSSGLFAVAGQPHRDNSSPPGEYHLCSVSLTDMANNTSTYRGTECDGDTDFSRLFPSVVITLKP